jgi:hypothetical protein
MGQIDPPGVIAMRVVLMILVGVVVPQIAGLLVRRALARSPETARVLGIVAPALVVASVLWGTLWIQAGARRASGAPGGCGTPIAAVLLVVVPGHLIAAELLQSRLHGRRERSEPLSRSLP